MTNGVAPPRPRSLAGPIILIGLGAAFLLSDRIHPWPILLRYWPVLLILLGLGKIWDSVQERRNPQGTRAGISMGSTVAGLGFVIILVALLWHARGNARASYSRGSHHETRAVEVQSAKSVHAKLEMPAGELKIAGGAGHLLDADFYYSGSVGEPRVTYVVSGTQGDLDIDQEGSHGIHFGNTNNTWDLRFANGVPLDLDVNLGAGQGNLRLQGVDVTGLRVQMGAGQLGLDLTGDRKKNLSVEIQGGVGQADIRLPKNVGVKVSASGGIGSIDTHGLRRDGDEYVNEAYGKSSVTLDMTVHGGIGQITLRIEP